MESPYLSERDASQYLNLGLSSFRQLVAGDPDFPKPFVPGAKSRLYRATELDAYMEKAREREAGNAFT